MVKRRSPAAIHAATKLCASDNSDERIVGAHILRQGMVQDNKIMPDECFNTLFAMLTNEENAEVIGEISFALETYDDPRIAESLARFKSHPNAELRLSITHGLNWRKEEPALMALLELMGDSDDEVRNWATFHVGQTQDADSDQVRDALIQRLNDSYDAVRGEALKGLAERQDERAIEPLIRELEMIVEAEDWWDGVFEAAVNMPDSRLYPALIAAKDSGIEDATLDHAIALCRFPAPEEGEDKPTNAKSTCPVCWRRRAFRKSDRWQFCKRCGWSSDPDQRANPDSTDGYNRRSLNQERERWRMRLEAGGENK